MEDFVTKGQESMELTWRELADKAGVSRVALYRIKEGQVSEISVETAARVAAALNTTIDKLFVINEDKKVTARADTERVKSLLREDIELCDLVEETVQELSIIFMLEERDPGGAHRSGRILYAPDAGKGRGTAAGYAGRSLCPARNPWFREKLKRG